MTTLRLTDRAAEVRTQDDDAARGDDGGARAGRLA